MASRGRRAKGEGALYQRADGRWVGEIDLGYEGANRRRKPLYGRTQGEVLGKLNQAKRNLAAGLPVADTRMPLGRYLTGWLDGTVDPSSLSPTTKASYRYFVEKHVVPTLGGVRLDKLKAQDVQLLLKTKRDEGLSDRTRQLIHATLRRALGDAQRTDLVGQNVVSKVVAPRPERDPAKVHELALEQVRTLLEAAKGERLYALWLVLISMGLRKGEALALRWSDLDMGTGTVNVQRTLSRVKGQGLSFGATKTEHSRRSCFMPAPVQTALQSHWVAQEAERLRAGSVWEDHGLVFATSTGRPIEPSNLNRQFDTLLRHAGLGHERVHNLRHTAATLLRAYGGVDLHDLKEILGHSTIATTSDLYGHVVPVVQRELMNNVASLLVPPADGQAVN